MRRQSRVVRRSGVRVELRPRDEALLCALARFRLARTSDLVALVFRGVRRDTATERLRRLFDAGFLALRVEDRSEENVYSLGLIGWRWAEGQGLSPGRPPKGGWEHHLAVVRTWIEVARALHGTTGWRLSCFRPEWEVREFCARRGEPLVPDAIAEISASETNGQPVSVRIAIEVDLGTEPSRILRSKLRRYRDQLLGGQGLLGSDFCLAVVVGKVGVGRLSTIRELLEDSWPGLWRTWTLDEGPRDALGQLIESGARLPLGTPLAARGGEVG